jgi:RimJ/RimL family protein N-acetyltransferase
MTSGSPVIETLVGGPRWKISYRLRRDFWHRVIATEAAKACRDHAFDRLRLSRLISSIRVAEKVGMARETKTSFYGIPVNIYAINAARVD